MPSEKQNHYWIGLTVLLLVMSLVLSVGVAFGRYRTKLDPFEYWFAPRAESQLLLWGVDDQDGLTDLPGSWTLNTEGSTLEFAVTNGTSSQYSANDLNFMVRIAVPSNAGNVLDLLLTSGGTAGINTTAQAIKSGTRLYEEFGEGWLYRFYDSDGNEMTWTLAGGTLSEFRAELFCKGKIDDSLGSLMQFQVIATE